jgi:hypothetical protein
MDILLRLSNRKWTVIAPRPHSDNSTRQDVGASKNLQVSECRTGLYSANSKLAGAHGDPPWQTSRAL